MYSFLIKNGRVLDPSSGVDTVMDLAVEDGVIVMPESSSAAEDVQIIDAAGCLVVPGLIDAHAHVNYGSSDNSFQAETGCFPSGVTTVLDGGTCGVSGFQNFYNSVIAGSQVTIKSFLNVGSVGQTSHLNPEELDPARFETEKILRYCEKYRDNIVGIKLRLGAPMLKNHGTGALTASVQLARQAGLPLVVHMIDCPLPVDEVLPQLAPGDVYCHVFHNTGDGVILDKNGNVLPEVFEAQRRGVLFDVAHGRGGASIKMARAALDQGFKPDLITSDLSRFSLYRMPAHSLGYILSEYLHLGFSVEELIRLSTETPAKAFLGNKAGFIRPGAPADLAILRVLEKPVRFTDYLGEVLEGSRLIRCEMTLKSGEPVFRQTDFF
ncbi:amidohydrolase family protein [Breznakiella homolactica]|uniref:Amidohydrolase family protein n=1 Tax=Breznakiella homolactica TaxID=2798577 RepID=A0A7T7XNJ5_9SPIR|nr:amidohydrolase family protein [Breznakiella homolactica]QQO09578.1 amidohydrolase family protein [Breznakiella homolactica]